MRPSSIGHRFLAGFNPRTAFLGFLLGIFTATSALFGVSVLLVPKPAEAATPYVQCFYRGECLKPETKKGDNCDDNCDTPGVICHCFEPGHGCKDGGGACYLKWPAVQLSVSIGGATKVYDFADYVSKVFNFAVFVSLTVAGVMFVIGGFRWLNAGDNPEAVNAGKKRIIDALIGILLTTGAVVILSTVNPDILALRLPKVPVVKKVNFQNCKSTEQCVACGKPYVVVKPLNAPSDWAPKDCSDVAIRLDDGPVPSTCKGCKQWGSNLANTHEVFSDCYGKSCKFAGCANPTIFRCRELFAGQKADQACSGAAPPPAPAEPVPGQEAKKVFACMPCKTFGTSCSTPGKDESCCGGYCGKGLTSSTCTNGEAGDDCDTDAECKSNLCQTKRRNSCSWGRVGAPCDSDSECREGNVCVLTTGLGICLPPKMWGFCSSKAQCPGGDCFGTIRGDATKAGAIGVATFGGGVVGAGAGSVATAPFHLVPVVGSVIAIAGTGAAAIGGAGAGAAAAYYFFKTEAYCLPTGGPATCTTNEPKYTPGLIGDQVHIPWTGCPTHQCMFKSQICTDRQLGSPCNDDSDCASGKCVDSAATIPTPLAPNGVCVNGAAGERCDKNSHCWKGTGHCYKAGDYNVCSDGFLGDSCTAASGCEPGFKCDVKNHFCIEDN